MGTTSSKRKSKLFYFCNFLIKNIYSYETSNGIAQQESGQVQNAGSENEAIAVRGQYSYTGDDGQQYQVNYVADENGFQPAGAHLPRPWEILEKLWKF